MSKITVVGIGPGNDLDITYAAVEALKTCDAVVSYKYYTAFIEHHLREDAQVVSNGMKREVERARQAVDIALQGKQVSVISSGDAGIYGMASLIYDIVNHEHVEGVEIEVVPGISAFQKAAALLGAPMGHDFCVISLSDLLTPWSLIEKRITAAATCDFITAVYNPKSVGRYWELYRLKEIFLEHRKPETVVGFVRQAGRDDESVSVTTLDEFNPEDVDMFTVVIIGNSQTYNFDGKMVTPRGYFAKAESDAPIGQSIMIESFRTIASELKNPDIPLYKKWPMLHAIHTTADFDMENILKVDVDAPERIFEALTDGGVRTIVTDVTMAASGIRKGALSRLGIEVKCYLNNPETEELAKKEGITRTQAGIRMAVQEHPDALFVFGNAPTALIELCSLIRHGKAKPCGIVVAPVGFVHVCESKHMAKVFMDIPKIIVDGRKGGSNLAATLTNSILCWPDAEQLKPGRDV